MSTVTLSCQILTDDELTSLAHPRACGQDPLDITAFLDSQRHWDLERDNGWTGVEFLFTFHNDNLPTPNYELFWMYHNDRLVLDLDHHPVLDYKDIPLTVSSQVEGGLLEAIRCLDPRIRWQDFHARMSAFPSRASDKQRLTEI